MHSETEKAYLAGVVDGEGHITLSTRKSRAGTVGYTLIVGVTNTYRPLIEALAQEWNGRISEGSKGRMKAHKPASSVVWVSRKAESVLREIQPYLRIKHEQCRLALEFIAGINPAEHRTAPVSPATLVRRDEIRAEIQGLNGRGKVEWAPRAEKPALTCQWCGSEFRSYQKLRKYCSQDCNLKAGRQAYLDRKSVEKACATCGERFTAYRESMTYCSRKCRPNVISAQARAANAAKKKAEAEARREASRRPCAQCGTPFVPKQPNRKYCSLACGGRAAGSRPRSKSP